LQQDLQTRYLCKRENKGETAVLSSEHIENPDSPVSHAPSGSDWLGASLQSRLINVNMGRLRK